MAALGVLNPTLLDIAKATDPSGKIGTIIEILNETNEILTDMSWVEGNLATGHRSMQRTGIPAPTWRKLGGGVLSTKATQAQITDDCGMLEAYAVIDKALADLNGNTATYRLQQDRAFLEGMNQEVANTLFYGNSGLVPETFTGLSPRFSTVVTATAASAENVIDAGGTGTDNASIWLVVWGPDTCFGIIPKGSTAGFQMNNKGQVTVEDASNGSNTGAMEAYRTHYRWDVGLAVPDWRYVVRICNIDKSLVVKDAASGPDLPDLLFQAMNLIPNLGMGRPAIYLSRAMLTNLRRQTANLTKSSTLETAMVGGKMVTNFQGIPLRRCDALSADEARVV